MNFLGDSHPLHLATLLCASQNPKLLINENLISYYTRKLAILSYSSASCVILKFSNEELIMLNSLFNHTYLTVVEWPPLSAILNAVNNKENN